MDYFWLKQDRRYINTPVIEGFYQTMRRSDFMPHTAFKIPERNVVFCNSNKNLEFIDILDQQLFLITGMVKQVFQMYERDITYKFFCCINNITGAYEAYYAPILPFVDCLVKGTEAGNYGYNVQRRKIGSAAIFRLQNSPKEMVVIRLDVAESLLRRKPKGVELERLVLI